MAIKILQYTFDSVDNSNGVVPIVAPSSVQLTYEDSTVGRITTRIVYSDIMPTSIKFASNPILTLDYINVTELQSIQQLFWGNKTIKRANISNQVAKNLTNIQGLFYDCQNIEKIEMSNLILEKQTINSSQMFQQCYNLTDLNLEGSRFNMHNMNYNFYFCRSLISSNTSAFITDRVTDFTLCFAGCTMLKKLDITTWEMSNAKFLDRMFENCSNLESINLKPNFVNSSATNIGGLFAGCNKLRLLHTLWWDTSNVTNMNRVFENCTLLKILNLSSFNTSSVTTNTNMFNKTSDLTVYRNRNTWTLTNTGGSPTFIDVNGKILGKYTFDNTVADCLPTLIGGTISSEDSVSGNITTRTIYLTSDTLPSKIDFNAKSSLLTLDYLYINQNITTLRYSFISCTKLTNVDASYWDVSNVTDYTGLFESCTSLITANISNWKIKNGIGFRQVFYRCGGLETVEATNLDLSGATDLTNFFNACGKLQTVIGIEDWDVSNITNLTNTFVSTSSLEFDISKWNITSKLTNLSSTFSSCYATIGDLSNWDTSNVTNFYYTFCACRKADLRFVENWNTDKADNMFGMFESCNQITELDLSNWNTSNVKNMGQMFRYCSSLHTLNISNFNTSNVTNMQYMFDVCTSLTSLDLSSFNISKVTSMREMFSNTSIVNLDLSSFKITDNCNINYLFIDSGSLESIDVSNFQKTNDFAYVLRNHPNLKTIGMLYSSTDAVNKFASMVNASLTPYNTNGLTIYYHDADPTQLTPVDGVTFIKYEFPNTVSLPPHISLHALHDGTKDELDIKTGILTRNVGKFVLDGSFVDSWRVAVNSGNTVLERSSATGEPNLLTLINNYGFPKVLDKNNSMTSIPIDTSLANTNDASKKCPSLWMDTYFGNYFIRISIPNGVVNDKNQNEYSYNDANRWLNENPITIVYKLSTPTTEKLILNYNHSCDYGMVLPTGAMDYYNVVTSEYSQNISSIELKGEREWDEIVENTNTVRVLYISTTDIKMKASGGLYCDNDMFPNIQDDSDVEHCRVHDTDNNKLYIYISKDKLLSPDLIGFQLWLQENPFTVYYELTETNVFNKNYSELNPELARWEMMDSVKEGIISYTSNNNDNLTLYPNMTYVAPSVNNFDVEVLEPNTEYTVYADNTGGSLNLGGNTSNFTSGSKYTSGENKWLTFNSSPDVENIMLIKGDTTDEVVPYFEGMKSVQMPVLRTSNNDCYIINIEKNCYYTGVGGNLTQSENFDTYNVYVEGIDSIKLECDTELSDVSFWDNTNHYITGGFNISYSISVPSNTKYFKVAIRHGNTNFIINGFDVINDIKTNILSTPEDLELRGIEDVKDELNLLTGEVTQRIGKIVLDGSQNMDADGRGVYIQVDDMKKVDDYRTIITCDKLPVFYQQWDLPNVENGISGYRDMENKYPGENWLYIKVNNSVDVDEVRQILTQNPITVQYELSVESIKTVDLKCVNQAGEVIDNLCAFEDGTINLSSDTGLIPTLTYAVPSTNTFYLPSMKTGTRYTLKYPSASGNITIGNIKYNINSPSMLFTTPLTIVGDTSAIIFSDENPQDVMLIEGAYNTREIPLFTGVKSVVNPTINIIDNGTEESRTYRCQEEVELRSLPNGVADKLDIVGGKLTRAVGIRPYQEGDEDLPNTLTDGYNTIYQLSKPTVSSVTFVTPVVTSDSTMHLSSEALIPQLNYRVPSNNNFPLDLLEPNKTYTLYANTLVGGSYTLGGTHNGYFTGTEVIALGDVTNNLLTFDGDLGLSDVVLIKGNSMNSELPYFEGLKTVENATITIAGMQGEENSIILDDSITLRACGDIKDTIDMVNLVMTQRLSEITLKGTEPWSLITTNESINDEYILFGLVIGGIKSSVTTSLVCDKFNHKYQSGEMHNQEGIYAINNQLRICVKKTTIGGETVDALKTWLGQNNTRVIYALINPIEYQLQNSWTSTPPTSYNNRTTISSQVVDSLKPMISVTIATTTLEEIVSNLEARNTQLEEENLATMLALTEVYEMMYTSTVDDDAEPASVSTWNRRIIVSSIGMVYAKLVKRGVKSIEEVPTKLRIEVQYAIDNGLV